MTAPQPQPAPTGSVAAGVLVAAELNLAAQLAAAIAAVWTIDRIIELLSRFPGVKPGPAGWLLFELMGERIGIGPIPRPGTAAHGMYRHNLQRRASYLVNAARRLSGAVLAGDAEGAVQREQNYLRSHRAATAKRLAAALAVDWMLRKNGNPALLGWQAILDAKTDATCRKLHGTNFDPLNPPIVEGMPAVPGSVHPYCRCVARRAWPTPVRAAA